MEKLGVAVLVALGCLIFAPPTEVGAQGTPPVVEQILDILRDQDQIDQAQYDQLLQRAKSEEAKRTAQAVEAAKESASPAAEAKGSVPTKDDFRVYWKQGVRFETPDQEFKFRIGGRMQLDMGILKPSGAIQDEFDMDSFESGVRFRRARIYLSGTLYKDIDFKFQYDFAGGVTGFKDVYVAMNNIPGLQRIQVGHFKEPFSLEQLTSSNDITFMERSLMSPFEAARNTGFGVFMNFLEQRMTFAAGAFRIVDNLGDGFGGESPYSISARVTGLPWYEDDGRQLLHLGFSYAHNFRSNSPVKFRQRPSTGFGPRLIDTGEFLTDDVNYIDPEVALVVGPFSLQAEYLQSFFDSSDISDPEFFGWYAEASYFVTGENRPYNRKKATFTRVQPHHDFGWGEGSGWGAFQVGARLSQLRLSSGDVDGGRLQDLTLGLNWYLNPNARIMFNYVYADRDPIGSENVYQMRFQLAF